MDRRYYMDTRTQVVSIDTSFNMPSAVLYTIIAPILTSIFSYHILLNLIVEDGRIVNKKVTMAILIPVLNLARL